MAKSGGDAEKAERLAEALRANLRRRKAQKRARDAAAKDAPDAGEAPPKAKDDAPRD